MALGSSPWKRTTRRQADEAPSNLFRIFFYFFETLEFVSVVDLHGAVV